MSPAVAVRPVRDEDDLDALNAGCVAWIGQGLLRAMVNAAEGVPVGMWVAELDGVPAGFANAVGHGFGDGHRGLGYVHVLPEHRGRGVGSALWQEVRDVCTPSRVPGVSSQLDRSDVATLHLLTTRGWHTRGTHYESELDLTDIGRLESLRHPPAGSGVEFRTLPAGADDRTWHAFADLFNRLSRDAPDFSEGAQDTPYGVLRAVLTAPWQVMGAWAGERLVGFTAVAVRDPAVGRLNTWFTAVERDHRRRGLATALKTVQAFQLRDAGWRSIATQNMVGNDAILAANARLGFRRSGELQDVVLDFT